MRGSGKGSYIKYFGKPFVNALLLHQTSNRKYSHYVCTHTVNQIISQIKNTEIEFLEITTFMLSMCVFI